MASYTTNLNLKKPAGSENVAIGDINNNMDTIDTAYGTLNNNLATVSGKFAIAITSGANLNNLTSAGFYDCPTGAIAQSLSHCPTTGNFTMFVMSKGSYVTQVIFAWSNVIYTRTQTSSGFEHWFQFTGTDTGS